MSEKGREMEREKEGGRDGGRKGEREKEGATKCARARGGQEPLGQRGDVVKDSDSIDVTRGLVSAVQREVEPTVIIWSGSSNSKSRHVFIYLLLFMNQSSAIHCFFSLL